MTRGQWVRRHASAMSERTPVESKSSAVSSAVSSASCARISAAAGSARGLRSGRREVLVTAPWLPCSASALRSAAFGPPSLARGPYLWGNDAVVSTCMQRPEPRERPIPEPHVEHNGAVSANGREEWIEHPGERGLTRREQVEPAHHQGQRGCTPCHAVHLGAFVSVHVKELRQPITQPTASPRRP